MYQVKVTDRGDTIHIALYGDDANRAIAVHEYHYSRTNEISSAKATYGHIVACVNACEQVGGHEHVSRDFVAYKRLAVFVSEQTGVHSLETVSSHFLFALKNVFAALRALKAAGLEVEKK